MAGLAKLDVEHALSIQHSAFSQDDTSVERAPSPATAGSVKAVRGQDALADSRWEPSASLRAGSGATPHRPFKIVYATLYYDIRPTFVVDITEQFEGRLQSLMAYTSQFTDQEAGKGDFPAQAEIRSRIEAMARFYGMMAGVTYAEPFLQKEIGLVEDLTVIPVKSI